MLNHPGWPLILDAIDASIAQKRKDGGSKCTIIAAALAAHDAADCFEMALGHQVTKPYTGQQARFCQVAMQELAVSFSQTPVEVTNACKAEVQSLIASLNVHSAGMIEEMDQQFLQYVKHLAQQVPASFDLSSDSLDLVHNWCARVAAVALHPHIEQLGQPVAKAFHELIGETPYKSNAHEDANRRLDIMILLQEAAQAFFSNDESNRKMQQGGHNTTCIEGCDGAVPQLAFPGGHYCDQHAPR